MCMKHETEQKEGLKMNESGKIEITDLQAGYILDILDGICDQDLNDWAIKVPLTRISLFLRTKMDNRGDE